MTLPAPSRPLTLGLFEKRIDGDDCLMELARLRFQQSGMGAEMHAGTPEELNWSLRFRPSEDNPVTVHLPRSWRLIDAQCQTGILHFASRFAGRVYGFVIHDHPDLATRSEEYVRAARELESGAGEIPDCPMVFVEYAAGLELSTFAEFFGSIRDLVRISACIDIGHVGIQQARNAYSKTHAGEDICALKSRKAALPSVMSDLQAAVNSSTAAVLGLVEMLGATHKPVHFHLHDGHPLSTFSPFGVSDHLSFLEEVPLDFEYLGRRSAPLMFGPSGLSRIIAKALETIGGDRLSLALEIHPASGRLPLGDATPLFRHWSDKTNAERMNQWLSVLSENHRLLLQNSQCR